VGEERMRPVDDFPWFGSVLWGSLQCFDIIGSVTGQSSVL